MHVVANFDSAENIAGALRAAHIAGFAADLGGDAVVEGRDQQLGVALETDNGELTDGHKQPAAFAGEYQFIIKPIQHALRQRGQVAAIAAAVAATRPRGLPAASIMYHFFSSSLAFAM